MTIPKPADFRKIAWDNLREQLRDSASIMMGRGVTEAPAHFDAIMDLIWNKITPAYFASEGDLDKMDHGSRLIWTHYVTDLYVIAAMMVLLGPDMRDQPNIHKLNHKLHEIFHDSIHKTARALGKKIMEKGTADEIKAYLKDMKGRGQSPFTHGMMDALADLIGNDAAEDAYNELFPPSDNPLEMLQAAGRLPESLKELIEHIKGQGVSVQVINGNDLMKEMEDDVRRARGLSNDGGGSSFSSD